MATIIAIAMYSNYNTVKRVKRVVGGGASKDIKEIEVQIRRGLLMS